MKKTFKRIFALLLSVVLTLGALPMMNLGITASAATSGSCGSEVRWQFVEYPGQLNITGSGDMDFNDELPPWDSYKNSIKTVNIGHGVTSIPEMAFMECKNLTTVNLPKTLASIGGGAFMDCDSLVSIVIPDSVTEFGSWGTFSNCDKLENVKLGNGVKYLGERAFGGCVSLKEISLPNSVEEIGIAAFYECDNLRSVKLGTGVEHISSWAFTGCSNLKEFVTNEKLEFIGEQAFSGCQIESFFVPAGVTGIYRQGLLGCKEIVVSEDNPNYASVKGALFNKEKTVLIQYPVVNQKTSYKIPDGVTGISAWAFTGPVNLKTITIPKSVTNIEACAFQNADSITEIYFAGTEAEWRRISIDDYDNDPLFNATVHFAGDIRGDVNFDTFVNSSDALAVLKHSVRTEELSGRSLKKADVNVDGLVNATDAYGVLQIAVGLED